MSDRKKIGKRIKEIRLKKGISAYVLAEMTGMAAQNIYRLEDGGNSTIDVLSRITGALECRIEIIE